MPFRGMTNVLVTYNSNAITAYANQADLQATIGQIDVTDLASTAKEFLTEPGEWSIRLGGYWDAVVDGYLAPDAITPGTKRNASIQYNNVTYTWTAAAEIANYQIQATPTGVVGFSAELRLSGAPTRTVA